MRSHIARLFLITAIWAGMALYLIRPVQEKSASNSFASWLETVVKKDEIDSDRLKKQLYQLKTSDTSLNVLIEKASEIVSYHNEDFNLPLDAQNSDSDKVYNLLVWEWNSYQTGNGMGKASIPASFKSKLFPTYDKLAHSVTGYFSKRIDRFCFSVDCLNPLDLFTNRLYHIIPLSGGVAIGAP